MLYTNLALPFNSAPSLWFLCVLLAAPGFPLITSATNTVTVSFLEHAHVSKAVSAGDLISQKSHGVAPRSTLSCFVLAQLKTNTPPLYKHVLQMA